MGARFFDCRAILRRTATHFAGSRSRADGQGLLRLAMVTTLLVWMILSLVGTVEENRTTWLLLALIALAGRLAVEEPERLAACFPQGGMASGPVR